MKNARFIRPFIFVCSFTLVSVSLLSQNTQGPQQQRRLKPAASLQSQTQNPNANLYPAHDPVMIKQDDIYYLFTTGGSVASSTDMQNWKREYNVFEKAPEWITQEMIPGFRGGGYWAPDIQLVNGTYYLFYSFSAFGKNTSVIGVATNKTLHPSDKDFKWIDHGPVVQSVPNRDLWNAIDANLIMDGSQGWLAFGSFWGGIKLVKLAPDLLSKAQPEEWHTLARQPRSFPLPDDDAGDGTIEAPFIIKRSQYFYLFVSLDYCCRGVNSTYNVVVGRSSDVRGPYVDKDGNQLNNGGGTIIAKGNENWAAVGHSAHYNFDGKDYMIMHGYDKLDNGRSKLIIREMLWDSDLWPYIDL